MAIDPPVPEPSPPDDVTSGEALHFDYPVSDIVLRSCDYHNFHVSKLYIVHSSPVLRELILLSVSDTSGGLSGEEQAPFPVVKLPESGAILHNLLTFIFPVAPILPSTSEEIMELLAAAQKYQMDSVSSHIRGSIAEKDPPFLRPETAFHIYSLARKYELHREAVQAARVTLRLSMVIEDLGAVLDFPSMKGAYLYELWKYHERVRADLKTGVPGFRTSGLPHDMRLLRCQNSMFGDYSPPQWLDNYIKSIAGAPHLLDPIAFESDWARHIKEATLRSKKTCTCVDISSQVRRAFWQALTAFVHKTIEEANSTLALVNEEPTSETPDPPSVSLCLDIPDANFILRSSDQVKFRVHKSVLAMSSPFFKDLLSLPQPPLDELVDGLPVVQVPENADLLNSLVSLLYPIHRIKPGPYQKVFALLAACHKYDMVPIQSYIRDEVQRGTFPAPVKSEAFSAYALASSLGLGPEMEHAARLTLNQPMTFESLGEKLRQFNGPALCELIHYRAVNDTRRC